MAKQRANELAALDDDELRDRLAETKDRLFKMRFQRVTGQLESHAAVTQTKREVARIMTEVRTREIAAAEAGGGGEEPRR